MYSNKMHRWAGAIGLAMAIIFTIHTSREYLELYHKTHPFLNATGISPIQEGPFDATRSVTDPNLLPWIIDATGNWTEEEQQWASEPCGMLAVLNRRYPVWYPRDAKTDNPISACTKAQNHEERVSLLTDLGLFAKSPKARFLVLEPNGDLVIERNPLWELAMEPKRGLIMRRRKP